ncbi:hypothetical protein Z517_09394 [Fonsecaea pedrosoi CBS 271.37]|uniref:Uncharacterized protein n=1 Tax=Fonsecaea pedrosoi CBS 271.37 TaxID=1442368 RepID=A0A0D2GE95_9EURO|nr:uncharacterized protein Z517_09394 [Fonsecaea pedrosoi CBS 271.37]KIW76950.1 hypothetical protein Z517_09394 [Fonsecaea pedrosoi CBS 271.37]
MPISTTIGLMAFGWFVEERDALIVPTFFFGVMERRPPVHRPDLPLMVESSSGTKTCVRVWTLSLARTEAAATAAAPSPTPLPLRPLPLFHLGGRGACRRGPFATAEDAAKHSAERRIAAGAD